MPSKFLFFFLFVSSIAKAQTFVGLNRGAVEQLVKLKYPELQLESHIRNDHYKYVKYNNVNGLITWFIFYSKTDVCNETREIYDNVFLDSKRKELNVKYKIVRPDVWTYTEANEAYSVVLHENKWYFVLITTKATQ